MWPFTDDNEDTGLLSGFESQPYNRPEELDKILSSGVDAKTREMARSVDSKLRKVTEAGLDPELTEPRSSFLMDVLDTLDTPRQAIAGIADAALRGDIFGTDEKTGKDVGFGIGRGMDENIETADILRRAGVENPYVRGIVGFAGDVLTDPLTYLSLGTGAAAKAGGRAITETGEGLFKEGIERLTKNGVDDVVDQSNAMDEIFSAVHRGQEAAKDLKGLDKTSPAAALASKKLEDAREVFSSIFKDDEVLNADVFAKRGLKIGAELPFLGHFQKGTGATENILEKPGVISSALRSFSKAVKPGKLDIADIQFSDETMRALSTLNDFASDKLGEVGNAITKIPLIGQPIERAGKVMNSAAREFTKIFNRKALTGSRNEQLIEEYQNQTAGIKTIARERALQAIGPENLKDADSMKDAYLLIDEAGQVAQDRAKIPQDELEALMRGAASGKEAADGELIKLKERFSKPIDEAGNTPENLFRQEMEIALQNPNTPQATKDIAARLINSFDQLAIEEADSGISHGLLEYYVTHKYQNPSRNPFTSGANTATNFTKTRKYSTVGKAFEEGGKVADIDVPTLLEYRIKKSLTLQAQRSFAQRMMLENSIPEHLVKATYQAALLNPNGPEAKILKRNRFDLQPQDLEKLKEGDITNRRQKGLRAAFKTENTPEEAAILARSYSDFADQANKELWASGYRPKDSMLPDGKLGEIGRRVNIPGGGEMYLPKAVGDAYEETIAAKDLFKEKYGNSAIGKALVNATDTASSIFKKWVTIPFPAYWAQNVIGDRFRQMTGGLSAMDPGVQARTYDVLAGKSAITNKAGQTLNRDSLERIIKQNGLNYSVNDYLGTIESFGKMNTDKFMRTKESMFDNLFSGAKGSKGAFLSQVHDKFQKSFDGFFRVSEIVRNFEQGTNLNDAIKAANDMYFNYRNMTPVEASYFRRFYMFYGYMSKATRASMTDLVSNPGNLTLQMHGARGLAEFLSSPDAAPSAELADLKLIGSTATAEQLSRVIGKTPEGNPIFARGFAAPINAVMQQFNVQTPRNLSVGELMDTAMESGKRTLQKQFASANPFINAAAQLVSGKNLYFDKPLDSEFLRKIPSLNALAEKIAGYKYNELPIDLDAASKTFLKAVPDGKGRLIADPSRMWILMNLVPGLGRATSMAGTFTNADVPTKAALGRFMTGINIQDSDLSRTYLATQNAELDKFIKSNSVNQRIKNMDAAEQEDLLGDK